MADPFTGEIRIFCGNYAPYGWAYCQGQSVRIADYPALYAVIGTAYGGDGVTSFMLPNLQGAVAVGQGQGPGLTNRTIGQAGGQPTVTLSSAQMPMHTHAASGRASNGAVQSPDGAIWAQFNTGGRNPVQAKVYATSATGTMSPTALAPAGSSMPHDNMQPFLAVQYIICLEGEFPPRPD